MSDINFIRHSRRRNLLVGGIIGALSVSAILAGTALLGGPGQPLTASIGDTPTEPTPMASRSVTPVASNIPRTLSDTSANSLARGSAPNTIRYYETQTGKSFQVDLQSRKVSVLSDKKLPGFLRSIWDPRGNDVVSMFSRPTGTIFQYYNYDTKQTALIGSPATSVAFSPNGTHVVFAQTDSGTTTIYTANSDGSEPREVIGTRLADVAVSWPLQNALAVVSRHGNTATYDLTFVRLDGSLSPLLATLENLEYTWSADGTKFLYSYFDAAEGVQLWYLDTTERVAKPLAIGTGARKCGWASDNTTIVCGVPSNTNLSRDTSSVNSATQDDIYRINTLTGQREKMYSAQGGAHIGVIDPLVSSTGSFFVFTNLFDQHLYTLEL